jgi:hypothetical protein
VRRAGQKMTIASVLSHPTDILFRPLNVCHDSTALGTQNNLKKHYLINQSKINVLISVGLCTTEQDTAIVSPVESVRTNRTYAPCTLPTHALLLSNHSPAAVQ